MAADPVDPPTNLPLSESGPAHGGAVAACRDCDHPLSAEDRFCSACGQPTRIHPPTLWEFVHEWLLHYVALEGKLWKSLWALMARPGFLTLEYLAGRRQRYVQPLRLLLTLGVLFFLVLKLGSAVELAVDDIQLSVSPALPASAASPASSTAPSTQRPAGGPVPVVPQDAQDASASRGIDIKLPQAWTDLMPAKAQLQLQAARERARADPRAEIRRLGKAMLGMAPYAVLVSLPLFAGLLKLLFWPMPFGVHFVFALHLHAAWYGCLLLIGLLPWLWAALAAWAWANLYPVLALQRVHGIGWRLALGKSIALAVLHLMLILAGIVGLVLLGVTMEP